MVTLSDEERKQYEKFRQEFGLSAPPPIADDIKALGLSPDEAQNVELRREYDKRGMVATTNLPVGASLADQNTALGLALEQRGTREPTGDILEIPDVVSEYLAGLATSGQVPTVGGLVKRFAPGTPDILTGNVDLTNTPLRFLRPTQKRTQELIKEGVPRDLAAQHAFQEWSDAPSIRVPITPPAIIEARLPDVVKDEYARLPEPVKRGLTAGARAMPSGDFWAAIYQAGLKRADIGVKGALKLAADPFNLALGAGASWRGVMSLAKPAFRGVKALTTRGARADATKTITDVIKPVSPEARQIEVLQAQIKDLIELRESSRVPGGEAEVDKAINQLAQQLDDLGVHIPVEQQRALQAAVPGAPTTAAPVTPGARASAAERRWLEDEAQDFGRGPEVNIAGEEPNRVVWGVKSGDTLKTSSLDNVGYDGGPTTLRGIHVGDADFWKQQLAGDYGLPPAGARTIKIRAIEGDAYLPDRQYNIPPETGEMGSSDVLVTKRTQLEYGKDWVFEGENFATPTTARPVPPGAGVAQEPWQKPFAVLRDEPLPKDDTLNPGINWMMERAKWDAERGVLVFIGKMPANMQKAVQSWLSPRAVGQSPLRDPSMSLLDAPSGATFTTYGIQRPYGHIQVKLRRGEGRSELTVNIEQAHFEQVQRALAEGRPVPDAVLRDYPDLAGGGVRLPVQEPGAPAAPVTGVAAEAPAAPVARVAAGKRQLPWEYTKKDADFYIQTKGANAGKVMREPSTNSVGIKVDPEVLDANYAYFMFQNAEKQGAFKAVQKGTAIPFITQSDIDRAMAQMSRQTTPAPGAVPGEAGAVARQAAPPPAAAPVTEVASPARALREFEAQFDEGFFTREFAEGDVAELRIRRDQIAQLERTKLSGTAPQDIAQIDATIAQSTREMVAIGDRMALRTQHMPEFEALQRAALGPRKRTIAELLEAGEFKTPLSPSEEALGIVRPRTSDQFEESIKSLNADSRKLRRVEVKANEVAQDLDEFSSPEIEFLEHMIPDKEFRDITFADIKTAVRAELAENESQLGVLQRRLEEKITLEDKAKADAIERGIERIGLEEPPPVLRSIADIDEELQDYRYQLDEATVSLKSMRAAKQRYYKIPDAMTQWTPEGRALVTKLRRHQSYLKAKIGELEKERAEFQVVQDRLQPIAGGAEPPIRYRPPGHPIGNDMGTPPPRRPDIGLEEDLYLPTYERPEDGIPRKWEGARARVALEMEQWVKEGDRRLRAMGLDPDRMDFESVRPLFEALHDKRYLDTLSPQMREIYDDLRFSEVGGTMIEEQDMLDFLGEVQKAGLNSVIAFDAKNLAARFMAHPDYFSRLWKPRVPPTGAAPRGRLGVTPGFAKPRVDASFTEMVEAGWEPASSNPYHMAAMRRLAGVNYRESVKFVNRLKQQGLALPAGEAPEGWRVPRAGPVFEGRPIVDSSVEGGLGWTRPIAVPPQIADFAENAFGMVPSGTIVQQIKAWSNAAKSLKLMASTFQHMDFMFRAVGVAFSPTAIGQLAPLKYPSLMAHVMQVTWSPGARNRLAKRLLSNEPMYKDFDISPRMLIEEGWGVQGDISLIQKEFTENFLPAVRGTSTARKLIQPLMKANEFWQQGLFQGLYRETQFWALENMIIPWIRRTRPNATPRQVAAEAAEAVNIMFSTLGNWQTVLKSPALQLAARTAAFSSNESEALVRQAVRVLGFVKSRDGTFAFERAHNAGLFREIYLGLFIALAAIANVINFSATGKILPPESYSPIKLNDPYAPFSVGYNNRFMAPQVPFIKGRNGEPVYVDLVGQMDTIFRWALSPIEAVASRLNVIPRAVLNQISGETFFGEDISGFRRRLVAGAIDLAAPISVTQLIGAAREAIPAIRGLIPEGEGRLGLAGNLLQVLINLRAQPTMTMLDVSSQELFGQGYKDIEPFMRDMVTDRNKAELGRRQETGVSRQQEATVYFAQIEDQNVKREGQLQGLVELYLAGTFNKRETVNRYFAIEAAIRHIKDGIAIGAQKEFAELDVDAKDDNKRALAQYYNLFDEAIVKENFIPDKFDALLRGLLAVLTREQWYYIQRNTNLRPIPDKLLELLPASNLIRIRDSKLLREAHLRQFQEAVTP
jgi:hypothetical protein